MSTYEPDPMARIERVGAEPEPARVPAVMVDVDTLVARPDLPPGSFTIVASGDAIPTDLVDNDRQVRSESPPVARGRRRTGGG